MSILFTHSIHIFEILGLSIVLTFILAPLGIKFARRFELIDIPGSSSHKRHEKPTPLAGGTVLLVSLLIIATLFLLWEDMRVRAILASSVIIFSFGLWDDFYGLSAPQKILGQVLASVLLIWMGVSVHFLDHLHLPFLTSNIISLGNWGITVFWLVVASNAFNLIDSMDGLAIGLGGIAFAFFTVISFVSGQAALSALSATLLGVCIGLYFYNISPAHLFLGDSGSQSLGFILASIAILYNPEGLPQASSWFVPILLLGVPLFDTTLVVFSRLYRRKPIFQSDLGHTYHRLIRLGLDSRHAVLIMHISALLLSCIAIVALSVSHFISNTLFFITMSTGLFILLFLGLKPIE